MKHGMPYFVCMLALAVTLGCEKKQDPEPTATEPTPAAPAAPAAVDNPVPAAAALDLSKVPVEEQYEKEVEAEITAQNFEAQLEALEKEIKAE